MSTEHGTYFKWSIYRDGRLRELEYLSDREVLVQLVYVGVFWGASQVFLHEDSWCHIYEAIGCWDFTSRQHLRSCHVRTCTDL